MTSQRTQSPKQVAATRAHLAKIARIAFRYAGGTRIILVVTPEGDELYAGTDFQTAQGILIEFNHSVAGR